VQVPVRRECSMQLEDHSVRGVSENCRGVRQTEVV
jgi:hypothetical protein